MVGQVLGDRYLIQQQLAQAAGRRTLLARDLNTQALVVVKLLLFSDVEWQNFQLFEREVQTLKALSHPNVPRYLDYFEVNTGKIHGFALVQSYIAAQSLETQLKAGRSFQETDVKQIARAVLAILIYLHERQPPVIHRDLKPSNILLSEGIGDRLGQVYLVDFGSVQNLAAKGSSTMTVVGTYGYMPPEQFGDRTVPASDLYSLGATLIYLVTGTHPADLPQVDLQIQFESAANISPALANWLNRMTAPSLNRRIVTAREALQLLEQPSQNLIVKQPTSSKVVLTKDLNALEILIPPMGFNLAIFGLSLFAIAWNSFIFLWTGAVLSAPFPINLVFALFSLPFWGAGIGMVTMILFGLFGRVRLCLNQQQVALTYELFGLKYHRPRPAKRQDINKLEYTRTTFVKDSEGDRVEIKPQINLWAGTRKYELRGQELLTTPELDWLARELSNWLGMPISKE